MPRSPILAVCLAIALASCRSVMVEAPDGTKVQFSSLATAIGVEAEQQPDGSFKFKYTSDPQAQALTSVTEAAARVAAAAATLAPIASPQPAPAPSAARQLTRADMLRSAEPW